MCVWGGGQLTQEAPHSLPPPTPPSSDRLDLGKWRPVCTQNLSWESLIRAVFTSLHPLWRLSCPGALRKDLKSGWLLDLCWDRLCYHLEEEPFGVWRLSGAWSHL